jgi:hypothetical protein
MISKRRREIKTNLTRMRQRKLCMMFPDMLTQDKRAKHKTKQLKGYLGRVDRDALHELLRNEKNRDADVKSSSGSQRRKQNLQLS